jgi:transcriptional regulator with XRE-family HTH domain
MPRPYSDKFLLELREADPTTVGVRLARLCVEANLPAAYVAKALEISCTTIHKWFRGQIMKEPNIKKVEAFMSLVEQDMAARVLPAKDTADAKHYLSLMIGGSI